MNDLVGKRIKVVNLSGCEGFTGPGLYILPLVKDKGDEYKVAGIPLSPGFNPLSSKPRIYPKSPETLRELNSIHKGSELENCGFDAIRAPAQASNFNLSSISVFSSVR
jgi:hypothetical protein